jgi:hypothetical protein
VLFFGTLQNGTRMTRILGIYAVFKWNADDADLADCRGLMFFYFLFAIICSICPDSYLDLRAIFFTLLKMANGVMKKKCGKTKYY